MASTLIWFFLASVCITSSKHKGPGSFAEPLEDHRRARCRAESDVALVNREQADCQPQPNCKSRDIERRSQRDVVDEPIPARIHKNLRISIAFDDWRLISSTDC